MMTPATPGKSEGAMTMSRNTTHHIETAIHWTVATAWVGMTLFFALS
jgi:hypothetical protein